MATHRLVIRDFSNVVARLAKRGWSMSRIRHPDHCVLACCFDGHAVYQMDDSELLVNPGDILFFAENEERSARCGLGKPWSWCSVVFALDPDLGLSSHQLRNLLGQNPLKSNLVLLSRFRELAEVWSRKTVAHEMHCSGILTEIFAILLEEASERVLTESIPYYGRIRRAMGALEEAGAEQLSVADLARHVGLSESRFRHLFKEATGYSPTRYANLKKIEKAKDLLLSGTYNVSETAAELGFANIFYFSRLFKSVTGQPPLAFLKK